MLLLLLLLCCQTGVSLGTTTGCVVGPRRSLDGSHDNASYERLCRGIRLPPSFLSFISLEAGSHDNACLERLCRGLQVPGVVDGWGFSMISSLLIHM